MGGHLTSQPPGQFGIIWTLRMPHRRIRMPGPPAGRRVDFQMDNHHTFVEAGEGLTTGISVVVPVYNSEQTLEVLLARLANVLTAAAGEGAFNKFASRASRTSSVRSLL